MAKRYIRINYQNSPSTATPLNAVNLNKMDKGIDDCDNAIEDLYSVKFDKANIVNNLITTASGLALDARQGKALQDQITAQNDNLALTIGTGTIAAGITSIPSRFSIQKSGKMVQITFVLSKSDQSIMTGDTSLFTVNEPALRPNKIVTGVVGASNVVGFSFSSFANVYMMTDGVLHFSPISGVNVAELSGTFDYFTD